MRLDSIHAGGVLEFEFPQFTARVQLETEKKLHLRIIAGENIGFEDRTTYEVRSVAEEVVVLSWQETIGTSVVVVMDKASGHAYALVTTAHGNFLRLDGRVIKRH